MKSVTVIQHTSAEYLGLIEDHFEGRRIRFQYFRPFTEQGRVPGMKSVGDGLVLLGGGPWGSGGQRNVPSLIEEVELTFECLKLGIPIVGIGLGAQIIALASGGQTVETPLAFNVGYATRCEDDALNGYLPVRYPLVEYMRDRPVPPKSAKILAVNEQGDAALFQIADNVFGFSGHPGVKVAMAEDLIMEFEESPVDASERLDSLKLKKTEIEDALVPIMTGLVQLTGLMRE